MASNLIQIIFPGIWEFVFLLPLASHLVQARVQLSGHVQLVGGTLDKDVSFMQWFDDGDDNNDVHSVGGALDKDVGFISF